MPTRFFSDAQRLGYGRFAEPPSEDKLARYFHLDEVDLDLIRSLRGTHNRIGCAIQLGSVRFLGVFPNEPEEIPPVVLVVVAAQLGEAIPASMGEYWSGRQRWRHAALIRARYGFQDFAEAHSVRFRLTRWLHALCWAGDDRPGLLLERAVEQLMTDKILLPGISTLERFIARIRQRVQERRWTALAGMMTYDQRQRIETLLIRDADGPSPLDSLRMPPQQLAPGELMRCLERIDAIRALDLAPTAMPGVPEAIIDRLARAGRAIRVSLLARSPEPKRTAMLAALFCGLEGTALDDALELFDGLMAKVVKDAARAYSATRMRSLRDLDTAALTLADVAELAVFEPTPTGPSLEERRSVLLAKTSREDILTAMKQARNLARPPDDRHFEELCARWTRVRRLFSSMLQRVRFDANPPDHPVREALQFLSGVKNWTRDSMTGAPTGCISTAWRQYVFPKSGGKTQIADNRAYVFAVMEATRKALKRHDIFTDPSVRFADPTQGLLDNKTWETSRRTLLRALGRSDDAGAEIAALGQQLDAAYKRADANLPKNAHLRFDNGDLVLTQLDRLDDPPSLTEIRREFENRLPKVDLPDILMETAARTGFTQAFTHISEQGAHVENFNISLCAVLIAEACNIGFEPMTQQDYAPLKRDRLSWVKQNFIRDETLRAANARIVAAHDALPITHIWGTGDVASADGVRFVVRGNSIHAGPNPKYFGVRRGITWYNLVSDQFTGLGGVAVPGTLRDSLILLGLLLDQDTHFEPTEIMTDSAAYSDIVFGLFWLLGYRFSPRLADIGSTRFWRIDKAADYGTFNALSGNRVNVNLIESSWEDLLRLASSLKLGRVQAGAVMRILSVKDRPTSLGRALTQLGRIVKTLHILDYVDDEEKRRRILVQLNRQEFRHRLARRVCHGQRGELTTSYRDGQEQKLGALGLVLNMIAFWNATYIQTVVQALKDEGRKIDPADLAHISPLKYKHINFLGRYAFLLSEAVANGQLRPLRNPIYE